jgi:hypothetical protein
MRLNVRRVRREHVDDLLVAFPLATRISHDMIIVISGDDVKQPVRMGDCVTRMTEEELMHFYSLHALNA